MRYSESDRLSNGGVRRQYLVDFSRKNLFAAPIDDLLNAACDEQEILLVQTAQVPSMQPAVSEGCPVSLGVVAIRLHHGRTPHHDLALTAGRREIARLSHDADF